VTGNRSRFNEEKGAVLSVKGTGEKGRNVEKRRSGGEARGKNLRKGSPGPQSGVPNNPKANDSTRRLYTWSKRTHGGSHSIFGENSGGNSHKSVISEGTRPCRGRKRGDLKPEKERDRVKPSFKGLPQRPRF